MNDPHEGTIRVLVVDDTPENRRLYGLILSDLGAEVVEAASGEVALTLCQDQEYAMILLDVHLGGINGFETARQIRAIACCAYTPIVFVSAVHTLDSDAFAGYGAGAVDYLVAPVAPDILRAKARVFIDLLRLRHEVEATNCELRAANAELESFSYAAAHDLKAPIHHIASYAEALLRQEFGAQGATHAYLERIAISAKHLGELIDAMLALATLTRREFHRERVNLSALADEILAELLQRAPHRQVEWVVESDMEASGDAGMLRILLSNLLGNAFKFTAKTADARIAFSRHAADGETVFSIADNGAGFDLQAAGDRMFRLFQRMHRQDEFPGSGVGLATVERVVRRHGGRIWAESQPGQGATFHFTLGA